jgi:hypothetical protein
MYIGQKNNFWLVDLQRPSEISLVEYVNEVKKIHSSVLREEMAMVSGEVFLDEVVAE